ncbi:hypothetical protein BX616_010078 [Lobosporangium transversale]|uniref:F-box domain-containing protein n=1 Tax=Lobosporangium transversale TaxID=64571 RepID=A0A1Y2GWV3_9FUNG|nr:hypothetical protein BCR41DRAFT_393385 [Lobosporangium transversale]KAF9913407.1 hypothetical protein BX616_010078 [Lobosporangium transversale]ORZ26778.1 hypothetical protein BCR41DRAFT_393385 [Lobosporangium transversale]|eukprot:XP_021884541.1 hypothetical protein BCR41DRAFT_393385 [Lobosporangium transversale]
MSHINTNISPLDIPHIIENIAQYLLPQDLAKCLSVCKDWSWNFAPVLWREPKIVNSNDWQFRALNCYQKHIRILHTSLFDPMTIDSLRQWPWPSLNIQKLVYVHVRNYELSYSQSLEILQWLSTLTSLETLELIVAQNEQPLLFDQMAHVLSTSFPNLRNMVLMPVVCSMRDIYQIVKACSRCEYVLIRPSAIYKNDASDEVDISRKTLEEMPSTNIRRLCLNINGMSREFPFVALLRKCPLLQELTIEGKHDPELFRDLTMMIKGKELSQLKCLHLVVYDWTYDQESLVIELFRFTDPIFDSHGGTDTLKNDRLRSYNNSKTNDGNSNSEAKSGLESLRMHLGL